MFLVTRWTTENGRGLCACMYVPDSDDLFCVGLTYPEDPFPFVMYALETPCQCVREKGGGGGREN